MRHYGCEATVKADGSPVTAADHEAEAIILAGLARLAPGVPVLAEEEAAAGRFPEHHDVYFCVDPVDGTREFLARNGEFTVNIALVVEGAPVFGVIYAPALGVLWQGHHTAERMSIAPGARLSHAVGRRTIRTRKRPEAGAVGLVSRSHGDVQVEKWMRDAGVATQRMLGSSLKFCAIADGEADVTIRFASISEWDIAAGHAILVAAGGTVTTHRGTPLVYGRADTGYRSEPFLAVGRDGDF